jgi:hypothetical protein
MLVASLLMMVTIIGIPFGLKTLKLAMLALWPFGSKVTDSGNSGGCLSIIMNLLWILLGGIWICVTHLAFGLLLCITIIGIPFGMQHFKMAALALDRNSFVNGTFTLKTGTSGDDTNTTPILGNGDDLAYALSGNDSLNGLEGDDVQHKETSYFVVNLKCLYFTSFV